MCSKCDWEDFLKQTEDTLLDIEDLPPKASDYRDSIEEKIQGMADWAKENKHVTDKMNTALNNIRSGVEKWLKR